MQYGFVIPGGDDIHEYIDQARKLEEAGWDAVFVADGVYGLDPWVTLAAMAVHTKRIRLGTLLTPPSRRRPWKLASETATLDRLSGGRLILPVGLGAPDSGFDKVGEQTERKLRAQLMDESLEIITGFWSGQPFRLDGKHYHVNWNTRWSYTPIQQPRIPIWVIGAWPRKRSMLRATRYDGVIVLKMGADGSFHQMTPADLQEMTQFIVEHRTAPLDVIVEGVTPIGSLDRADEVVAPLASAGVTWWIESMWDAPGGKKAVRARIKQGPPRV